LRLRSRCNPSADVGFLAAGQRQEFVIGQWENGLRDAAGSPEFVELSERAINDRVDALWMADGSHPTDRLAGVFAYERRLCTTQLNPEVLSDLDHVYPMRATGYDQQRFAIVTVEDQRVRDGSNRTSEVSRRSRGCGDRLIEHADSARQAGGLQDAVHGLTVGMHVSGSATPFRALAFHRTAMW
jgi:hypothetical protein